MLFGQLAGQSDYFLYFLCLLHFREVREVKTNTPMTDMPPCRPSTLTPKSDRAIDNFSNFVHECPQFAKQMKNK